MSIRNPFCIEQLEAGTRQVTNKWRNAPIYISADANWLVTIANQSCFLFAPRYLVTFYSLESSAQQEFELTRRQEEKEKGMSDADADADASNLLGNRVEFLKEKENLYVSIYQDGWTGLFALNQGVVTECKDPKTDTKQEWIWEHVNTGPNQVMLVLGKNHHVLVTSSQRSRTIYQSIRHLGPLQEFYFVNPNLIFTLDQTWMAKLTSFSLKDPASMTTGTLPPTLPAAFDLFDQAAQQAPEKEEEHEEEEHEVVMIGVEQPGARSGSTS